MEIFALATTNVHWETFIKTCQESLGFSPTRGIDKHNINPKEAKAYVASLDLRNQPLECLRTELNPVFKHVHLSFVGDLEDDLVTQIRGVDILVVSSS